MIKKLYSLLIGIGIVCIPVACSDDPVEQKNQGENEIRLSGVVTRANGDIYPNLHLKAFAGVGDTTQVYIDETPISISDGLYEDIANDITFPELLYYPLGDNTISFYAYTGRLDANGRVRLTSGTGLANDALLSNQGYTEQLPGTISPEGAGTPGSAQESAEILQFRHLMTRLNVIIKVDETESIPVDPVPTRIQFRMGTDIRLNGTYNITQLAPVEGNEANAYTASNRSGEYTVQTGTNYVVPNGKDITQFEFTRLIIDDYTATEADLARLQITNIDGVNREALLVSGYAYDITFLIQRLEVQSIQIRQVPWEAHEITNEAITYDPYVLDLDLGDYDNTGLDAIEKVVLFTSNGREYVGGLSGDEMRFVTLPETGTVDSVALYTSLGMMIALEPDDYTVNTTANTLTVLLSEGGMRLEDPTVEPAEDNPYLITTPVQVFNIEKDLTASYKLVEDIDVNRLTYSDSRPLIPLGTFRGIFDGNNKQIQNLIMSGPGLITRNEGILKNLRINSGRINAAGANVAGSFCAENAGTIVACVNEARIIDAPDVVGGICGLNEAGATVIACINTGNIEAGETLGGICGSNENPDTYSFISCINTGLLTKEGTVLGGILGTSVDSPDVVVRNSFWLVGTAAKVFGGLEEPVGSGFVGLDEVSALSPEKLRNDLSARDLERDAETTVTLLNMALQDTEWGDQYEYVLQQALTGSVWPIPVKRGTMTP